jgi:hypothetical protein
MDAEVSGVFRADPELHAIIQFELVSVTSIVSPSDQLKQLSHRTLASIEPSSCTPEPSRTVTRP